MKRYRMIAALSAFLGVVFMKTAFPTVAAELRDKMHSALGGEQQAVSVFHELGKKLSLEPEGEAHADAATVTAIQESTQTLRPEKISFYVQEGSTLGEADEIETETPETPLPAVTAFLERQSAFSDYPMPENADFSYLTLPFDYGSPVAGYESSGFGFRLHPILNVVRFHFGTDFAANAGEVIVAFADGKVCFAGSDDSFGKHLKIDHGGGWVSHYCHCSRLCVKEGQQVRRGEQIALVGSTGLATGPHLHFELSRDGVFYNPEYYLNA